MTNINEERNLTLLMDFYELTMAAGYFEEGYTDKIGVFDMFFRKIPDEGGFAIALNATPRRRDKLASVLTWLANRHELNLPEDRRHERFIPKNPVTRIVLPDGTAYMCHILDISLSGAALSCPARPPIGTELGLGKMRGRVVRHLEDGLAVEFAVIQNQALLEQQISGDSTTQAG